MHLFRGAHHRPRAHVSCYSGRRVLMSSHVISSHTTVISPCRVWLTGPWARVSWLAWLVSRLSKRLSQSHQLRVRVRKQGVVSVEILVTGSRNDWQTLPGKNRCRSIRHNQSDDKDFLRRAAAPGGRRQGARGASAATRPEATTPGAPLRGALSRSASPHVCRRGNRAEAENANAVWHVGGRSGAPLAIDSPRP